MRTGSFSLSALFGEDFAFGLLNLDVSNEQHYRHPYE